MQNHRNPGDSPDLQVMRAMGASLITDGLLDLFAAAAAYYAGSLREPDGDILNPGDATRVLREQIAAATDGAATAFAAAAHGYALSAPTPDEQQNGEG